MPGINRGILHLHNNAPGLVSGYSFYVDAGNPSSYTTGATAWLDLSGNGNTVTLSPTLPTYDSSDGGGCFDMNGTSQYGTFNYSSSFSAAGASGYCCESWVKFNNFTSTMILFSKGIYGTNYDWGILTGTLATPGNTKLTQATSGTSQTLTVTLGTALSTATWYHIVSSGVGATTTSIYVNGVSQGSGSLSMSNSDTSSPAGMVGGYGPNNPTLLGLINGKMAIHRMYTTGLTAGQVLQNFNAQKSRFGY